MNSGIYEEKRKFNAIDALIILLLVIMILVVIFRTQIISLFNEDGTRKNVEITFVCESISNEIANNNSITDGSQITWLEADEYLGTLNLISGFEQADEYYYENNVLRVKKSTEFKTFSGKINGTAISNNGCYIGGTDFLTAGMTVTLTNGKSQFTVLITDVNFI